MPHPATMFFLLTLGVIFLSWIFDVYGLSVRLPHYRRRDTCTEFIESGRHSMAAASCSNEFYGFCPVGAGYRAMFGIGVATTFRVL